MPLKDLVVEARDDIGPVSGLKVTFSVAIENASFERGINPKGRNSYTATTDEKGLATATALTPTSKRDPFSVTAEPAGKTVNFSFTFPKAQ